MIMFEGLRIQMQEAMVMAMGEVTEMVPMVMGDMVRQLRSVRLRTTCSCFVSEFGI